VMRSNSRALVTATVTNRGQISRIQLSRLTGLSPRYITKVVDELIADKVLTEVGAVSGAMGRPRIMLSINPESSVVAGVWLSEDGIEIAAAGADGVIIARDSVPYEACNESIECATVAMIDGVRNCVAQAGRDFATLRGVGVTAAGVIDPLQGSIVATMNAPWVSEAPIIKPLGDALGVPIYLDSDVRASALAHQWRCQEADAALYMTFSDGVGSAFVMNYELFGARHGAPLIGHVTVDPDGPPCLSPCCGKRGCLEVYTSNYAFIRRIWPDSDPVAMTARERSEITIQGLRMAAEGDPDATKALAVTADYIGRGVANGVGILDPQVVYVGGSIVDGLPETAIGLVRAAVAKYLDRAFRGVDIKVLPKLDEFQLHGALALVLLRPYRKLQEMSARVFSLQVPSDLDGERTDYALVSSVRGRG
jgi:predicted NBD/HSP70 family sugar kinase